MRYFDMKKRSLFLLPICFLLLTRCNTGGGNSSLSKPVLSVNEDKNGLTWSKVDGASSYEIVVNDEDPEKVNNPGYDFEKLPGEYNVSIKAIFSDGSSSEAATYSYKTAYTAISDVSSNNNAITWTGLKGLGLEAKAMEGEYVDVVGENYVFTANGIYTFHAKPGFDEPNKTFYVDGKEGTKSIVATIKGENVLEVEMFNYSSNYQLNKAYDIKKYANNKWDTTTASLSLDTSNEGLSDKNCARLDYWHHGNWIKSEKPIEIDASYDTLSFLAKGSVYNKVDPENPESTIHGETYFSISFEIKQNMPLAGGINLQGVYISYVVQPAPTKWTKYSISLNDPDWKIDFGGSKMTFEQATALIKQAGYKIESLSDMLPYFGAFQFRCNSTYVDKGPTTRMWFDDFTLSNTGKDSSSYNPIALLSDYAFQSDFVGGKFSNKGPGNQNITLVIGENSVTLPVVAEINEQYKLHVTCDDATYGFDAILVTEDSGTSYTLESVTGVAANYLTNMKMERFKVIDDFESYAETGIGYDKNHADSTQRTGLRAAYYCDYYSGNGSSSEMGGNGWDLMGSNDYLNLDKTNGRNGGQAGQFKYKGALDMRYTTYGLYDGTAESIGSGKYFSFWAKGSEKRDTKLSVKVFKVNKVTPTNQKEDTPTSYVINANIVVPQNSDWAEYKVELKAGDTYYGVIIIPLKQGEDEWSYDYYDHFLLDDFSIYGDISPWGM